MARPKFVIEDSFDAIFRDLERISVDAETAMREEFGQAIGEVMDATPKASGQAASGWEEAADALDAKHGSIVGMPTVSRKTGRVLRSADKGKEKGAYEEKLTGKSGKPLKKATFIATNRDFVAFASEYGLRGPSGQEKMRPTHAVRDALKRLKKRFGPHFAAAIRANIRKPKKKKKTVIK